MLCGKLKIYWGCIEPINKTFWTLIFFVIKFGVNRSTIGKIKNDFNDAFWNDRFALELSVALGLPNTANAVSGLGRLRYMEIAIQCCLGVDVAMPGRDT